MLSLLTRIVWIVTGSLLFAACSALGAEMKEDNYEIFMGDLDGDGDDDFYFQQKPWYLILHGEIATPIRLQDKFIIRNDGGIYSAPAAFSLNEVDLIARVTNGSLRKAIWNHDVFLVAQANGSNTLLIRGPYASAPALLIKSSSSVYPSVAATYSTASHRGISDRNVTLRIVDINGDDINDVVLGTFGSVNGEYAFLGDGNNVHNLQVTVSSGFSEGTLVGATAGQFRVDESGAATYAIPISVPQGVAGVAPQISVNYSSQTGNGLLGYGASIAGTGTISRCRQTLLQDSAAKPITWGAEDRFCLNGQRLILIANGGYGAPGSVYKTEIDSHAVVTARGGTVGNPDYFEVEAKDGSKTTYGGTQDSKLHTVGDKLVHWAQSRFEDNMGNRIDYVYEGNYLDGQRIKHIYYAFPAPKSSSGNNARVEFHYIDRGDVSESFGSGGLYLKSTKILNSVVAYNGSSVFRKYNFFYNETAYSTVDNLSRLTSVQECTSELTTSCYPRTRFIWGTKSVGFSDLPSANLDELQSTFKAHRLLDFNGDGRQDLLWVSGTGSSRKIEYGAITHRSTGIVKQSFTSDIKFLTYTNMVDDPKAELELEVIDYNNDGRQDLAVCRPLNTYGYDCASWDLYLSIPNSAGGWNLSSSPIRLPFTQRKVLFGDLNADGLMDAYEVKTSRLYPGRRTPNAAVGSNTYHSFSSSFTTVSQTGTPAVPQTTFSTSAPAPGSRQRTPLTSQAVLGDVNGDGQLDILYPHVTSTPPCTSFNVCHESSGGYLSGSDVAELFVYLKDGDEFVYSQSYKTWLGRTTSGDGGNAFKNYIYKNQDINNDGLVDLIRSDAINWSYYINRGNQFLFGGKLTNISSSQYATTSVELFDYNQDGYLDVVWQDKQNAKLKLRLWDRAANQMGADTNLTFTASTPASSSYSVGDLNGDGFPDLMEIQKDMDIRIFNGNGTEQSLDKVYHISDGNRRVTSIAYGSLANSTYYSTIYGYNTSTSTDPSYCEDSQYPTLCSPPTIYTFDIASFYTQINRPFGSDFENANPAPILELLSPNYVVTQVSESAPIVSSAMNQNKTSYHYHHARFQAGGRGYLGFEKISTTDLQTGVKTETTYHQDWPFTGSPKSTVVTTKEGNKLSESTTTWEKASPNPGVLQVTQDKVTEISYGLNNNGAAQGTVLQTITTDTDYDLSGNVTRLDVLTSGQSNTSRKTTVNTYPQDVSLRWKGRLEATTTTTVRNDGPAVVRSAQFKYYGQNESWPGMLKEEIVEPGTNQLVTEYAYDSVGNKILTKKTANVKPGVTQLRQTQIEYDESKRFVQTTRDGLGNVVSGVLQRHPVYGVATQIRDANGVVTNIELNADGSEKARWDASGAGIVTQRAYCDGNVTCPTAARIRVVTTVRGGGKTTEYLDVLGRTVRSSKVMFDGTESHVDTEYDARGRVAKRSEPYFSNQPVYWSVFAYDLVDRPTTFTAPDGTVTTTSYSGYTTTTTADASGKKLTRTELRNSLGNLAFVTDHLGGSIQYGYDPLGNLTSATTVAGGKSITVKICYDKLGRKIAMHDPDKGGFLGNAGYDCATVESYLDQPASAKPAGWWFYKYNDFGELIEQTDTKKQVTLMEYDALGRMITRTEKYADNSVETHTRWFYDKYLGEANTRPETQLKLTAVVSSYGTVNESCGGANYCQTYSYDSISRVTDTVTYLPNESTGYINSVRYDYVGRPHKQYDALNGVVQTSGTRTYFNAHGYAQQINDIATGDVLKKTLSVNARGQIKEELRNNGAAGSTVNTYDNATGRLTNQNTSLAGILIPIQNVTYSWDALGNLTSRWNQSGNLTANGSTAKKDLRESFCYDGLNRLIKSHLGTLSGTCNLTADQQDQEYDGFGNITRKANMGNYVYGASGPHAVTEITRDGRGVGGYTYDHNGNQISGGGGGWHRKITYTVSDLAKTINTESNHARSEFSYGPDRARFARVDTNTRTGHRTVTHYLGNVERIQVSGSSVVEWKRYIAGAVYTVRTVNGVVEKTDKSFIFNDHLGSLDVVTNAQGKVTHSASFNAWGERRNGETWASGFSLSSLSLTGFDQSVTRRGYTGHEMLDDHLGLIHMNGRVYDSRLGRFLQADPFIQAATDTQSYNRYSYVLNNPLNKSDPSGFFFKKLWNELKPYVGAIVTIALISSGMFAPFAGMIGGALGGLANGGGVFGMAQGMVFGAFSGAFGGMGNIYAKFIAQGMVGGMQTVMAGGKFGHGFLSAGLGGSGGGGYSVSSFIQSAILGGVASEITGGKFKNGAASAAFMYAVSYGINKYGPGGVKADSMEGEPEDVSDHVHKNFDNRKVSVTTSDGHTEIAITLTVEKDMRLMQSEFDEILKEILSEWNTETRIDNHTYRVKTSLSVVNSGGDLQIKDWSLVPSKHQTKSGLNIGRDIYVNKGTARVGNSWLSKSRPTTAAHEFGHALGLEHQYNSTKSLMSYSRSRSLTNGTDLRRLANAYSH